MSQYLCTHCEHRFESEPAEGIICPKCFWSTSVKKEESAPPPVPKPQGVGPVVQESSSPPRFLFWAGGGALGLVLLGVSFFAVRHLQKQDDLIHKIEIRNSEVIASQAPELALLPEQQEILNRKVTPAPNSPLSESETKVLGRRLPIRSPASKGIQTPPWSEQEFETYLKGEEARYQIPLERSYRRKLKQIFRNHYLAAAQAFEARDYLKARDEWIRSLAFPVYQNDVPKHRGVVLTLLRPHINDTLSKIGMMNTLLAQSDLSKAEAKIQATYKDLHELLAKQSWEEASAKMLELENELKGVEKVPRSASPPPLPDETSLVDSDIREVLLAQVAPQQGSSPDWDALRQDVAEKSRIIQARVPAHLEEVQKRYAEALSLIQVHDWRGARELLERIDFPEELAEDARAKIQVIDSIPAALDSQKNSG